MESYRRSLSDILPIGNAYLTRNEMYDAQIKISNTIEQEIDILIKEIMSIDEAKKLNKLQEKIVLAKNIFCAGTFGENIERGA